jgi:AraC-like DNA-binding protein
MTRYFTLPAHPDLGRFIQMYLIVRVKGTEVYQEVFTAKPFAALYFNFGLNLPEVVGQSIFKGRENVPFKFHRDEGYICGMHNEPIIGEMMPNTNNFYVVFTATGIHHFLQADATTILNKGLLLSEFGLDKKFEGLSEKLQAVDENSDAVQIVEHFLLAYFNQLEIPHSVKNMSPVTDFILRQKGLVQIQQLEEKFKIGRRWLEKTFAKQVGLSPKEFIRLVRFKSLLTELTATPSVSWAAIVIEYGYYDQSHLNKDFYDFTGQSPTQYFKETADFINVFFHKVL